MSEVDKKKEQNELDLFIEAVKLSSESPEQTRSILRFLDGETIDREKNDRPDLIKKCVRNGKTVFVGIEHFHVDQLSKVKNGKVNATGEECFKHIKKVYETGHEFVVQEQEVPEKTTDELMKQAVIYFNEMLSSSIDSLMQSLRAGLEKHTANIEAYKANTQIYASNYPVEIALLIDVFIEFDQLVKFDGYSFSEMNVEEVPIIAPLISSIVKYTQSKGIQYIVLLFKGHHIKSKVLAFRTGKIRKNIANQRLPIYDYIGDESTRDFNLLGGHLSHNKDDEGNYNLISEYKEFTHDEMLRILAPYILDAYKKQKAHKPFVTSKTIYTILRYYDLIEEQVLLYCEEKKYGHT